MRAIRGKIGVVAALVLAIALALSALAGLSSRPTGIPADGPWAIVLSAPQGDWATCVDDPAMTEPVTREGTVMVVSAPAATETDVRRVADCLSATLTGGTVQVGTIDPVDA
ncbi:hypothetical protein [uncultured Cellulomonas sp.]|uniref:hypothetical protein n=1 Tax=uncultured Cellulomonas sp. TaxID=189682 RepID=UPI0028E3EA74|nr:hypothetical protein [uncultured Cellulomonas sp.]